MHGCESVDVELWYDTNGWLWYSQRWILTVRGSAPLNPMLFKGQLHLSAWFWCTFLLYLLNSPLLPLILYPLKGTKTNIHRPNISFVQLRMSNNRYFLRAQQQLSDWLRRHRLGEAPHVYVQHSQLKGSFWGHIISPVSYTEFFPPKRMY